MKSTKDYNYNIDLLKGILVILVILGHFIPGALEETFSRYLIYSFHMPVFIGISGYLIKADRLVQLPFGGLCKKYGKRVFLPWVIAVNVYFFAVNGEALNRMGQEELLSEYTASYTQPYYHLWFVLGFLTYILITWAFLKLLVKCGLPEGKSFLILLAAGFLISLISRLDLFGYETQDEGIWEGIQDSLRLRNYIFFLLGMGIRRLEGQCSRRLKKRVLVYGLLLAAPFLGITITMFYYPVASVQAAVYFLWNGTLLVTLLFACMEKSFPRCRPLEAMGTNSLAFYLWHVLIRYWAVEWIGTEDIGAYSLFCAAGFLLLSLLIYAGQRVKPVRRFLFGIW